MIQDIRLLIQLFGPHCADTDTFFRLRQMMDDRGAWHRAHDLFQDIRRKTLKAGRAEDNAAVTQYMFEEVCAKSLYNLTRGSAPFDPDAPYWIVPNALALAKVLGIDTAEVVAIVTRPKAPSAA